MFLTGAGMNGGKYSNEIYDVLINEAARMPAGEDRYGVLMTAEDIMINEDQALMPLYYYVTINMIDTNKSTPWTTIRSRTSTRSSCLFTVFSVPGISRGSSFCHHVP